MLTKAAEPIWALVSGLPSPERQRRLMFMLQAYIDDSGNIGQGKTSVMSGYVASTETWTDFSDRWHAAILESPQISYFKASEAWRLEGEFAGWTDEQRDQKIERLIDVINATAAIYGAVSVLHNDAFKRLKAKLEPEDKDPFFHLFLDVMQMCMMGYQEFKGSGPLSLIFDSNDKSPDMMERMFREMLRTAPEALKRLGIVVSPPVFQDDKLVMPLQAADLVANSTRRFCERQMLSGKNAEPGWVVERLSKPGLLNMTHVINEGMLQSLINTRAFVDNGPPETRGERIAKVRAAFAEKARQAGRPFD
jgi:hypothetical protein